MTALGFISASLGLQVSFALRCGRDADCLSIGDHREGWLMLPKQSVYSRFIARWDGSQYHDRVCLLSATMLYGLLTCHC